MDIVAGPIDDQWPLRDDFIVIFEEALMAIVSMALWLPVSRPNFYNFTDASWLALHADPTAGDDTYLCTSTQISNNNYIPRISVVVMRRLLEVLPRSFGYEAEGRCVVRGGEQHDRRRPMNLTMRLDLRKDQRTAVPDELGPNFWTAANGRLHALGVTEVELHADENGAYTFTATSPEGVHVDLVRDALKAHIRQVFGGNFDPHPFVPVQTRRVQTADGRSIKAYNGLSDRPGARHDLSEEEDWGEVVSQPRGALAFTQLNVLVEGLWNLSLLPAYYLEHYGIMQEFANEHQGEFIRSIGDIVQRLTTDADGRTTLGQITVLHHFLSVTSTGPLTTLKSAIQSVRRRLLDEIIASLHRRNPLSQLRFSAHPRERLPELATGATANELKGYTAVVSAKFPLILGVNETARLAKDHLDWAIERGGPLVPPRSGQSEEQLAKLATELERVHGLLEHWQALTRELEASLQSLNDTIEHGRTEELLYEQKQTRSEQEAMAEIQRGRLSRPALSQSPARAAYNLAMLVLAIVAVVFTVNVSDLDKLGRPETTVWDVVYLLRYVWFSVAVAFVVLPISTYVIRSWREFRGNQPSYPYEFAIHLEERVSRDKLAAHIADHRRRRLATESLGPTRAVNRSYGRIETVSRYNAVMKAHIALTSRISARIQWPRYARFEIINEIVHHHRTGQEAQYQLVQCRIFGESPKPLRPAKVRELIRAILLDVLSQLDDAEEPATENGRTSEHQPTAKQAREIQHQQAEEIHGQRVNIVESLLRGTLPTSPTPPGRRHR